MVDSSLAKKLFCKINFLLDRRVLTHSYKYTRVCNLQLDSRDGTLFKYFKSISSSPQTLTIMEERETVSEFVKKAEEEVRRNHVTH